jgi:uncharacterized protein
MNASCIYEGSVRHRRFAVRRTEFSHRVALAYVDLDELPRLLGGRLQRRVPGLLRFRRRDYLGEPDVPLDSAVRDAVLTELDFRPSGPIRVLTQLRSYGHCFNPVSFYYCFGPGGEVLEAVVAEVTNTPWGERHRYVLRAAGTGSVVSATFEKRLHVSPFMGMDHRYVWRLSQPGPTLSVHIENHPAGDGPGGAPAFDATLALSRLELTSAAAARLSRRYPLAAMRVLALIYGHALALRLSGVRTFPHPRVSTP